jgi:hypothetical protein
VEIREVTDHWVRKTEYMLKTGLAYRQEGKHETHFTDLMYKELVADSMGQLEKIYERYNGISGELWERFRKADAENPQGKYGIHEYNLDDFGLSREELFTRNKSYFDMFSQLENNQQKKKNHGGHK